VWGGVVVCCMPDGADAIDIQDKQQVTELRCSEGPTREAASFALLLAQSSCLPPSLGR
jgi:hypothetical protein